MKINIPDCFLNENEDYITVPVMKRFCESNKIKVKNTREEIWNSIVLYAQEDSTKYETFRSWLNRVLKEGMKHIYIREFTFSDKVIENRLKDEKSVNDMLKALFPDCKQTDMFECRPDKDPKIQKYSFSSEKGRVTSISFELSVRLVVAVDQYIKKDIFLPIYVDIDLDKMIIFGRSKSKSKMYRYTEERLTEDGYKKTTKDLIIQSISMIMIRLQIELSQKNVSTKFFKRKIYDLFSKSTFTPQYIEDLVSGYSNTVTDFIDQVKGDFNIEDKYDEKMLEDINIFLEKYLSITRLKKEDLQSDRELYVTKTSSTDYERTKHSTTSPNDEPLQCKEKFFDTKKSISSSKSCDSVTFCHLRKVNKYFNEPFIISFDVLDGWCIIKLPRYVEEEDIQYVLSKFIDNKEL